MAYNPFNIFRRNQKVIFAVLTVFIMFMFTLSSGVMGGDFFENVSQWLGSRGKRGEAVCTLDGTKIYQRDIEQLQQGRRMANQYMTLLAYSTADQLNRVVTDQLPRLSNEARATVSQVISMEGQLPNFARDGYSAQIPRLIEGMRASLQRIVDSPTATADDKEIASTKLYSFALLDTLRQGDHYFAFAPNRTTRDKIDFMLWQKKADQLGIKFTTDDVYRLVRKELFNKLSDDVQKAVQQRLTKDMTNFTMSSCLKAVGEEFRVRAAQVAILGPDVHGGRGDKTYGGFPMFNPPYEAFAFYREYCSPTSYAAIPVPAANLIAEVERRLALPAGHPEKIAEPTENDLTTLYDKHKEVMASPDKESPGFKTPQRIRLEWFQLTGEEPYYKAEADKALKNEVLQTNLRAVMSAQVYGPTPGLVAFDTRSFVEDPLLTRRYAETLERHNRNQANRYGSSEVDFMSGVLGMPPLESSVVRPHNLAVAVGGMGGQLAAFGNPFAGLSVTVGGPMAYEIRDRVRVGMPAVLGMLSPGMGQFNTAVGGVAAYNAMLPKPLSIEAYRGEFMQTLATEKAKEIAFTDNGKRKVEKEGEQPRIAGDLGEFTAEVEKLSERGRAKDFGPAQKYIAEFLAKRGLTQFGHKTARTEWDLEEDPELAPLVAAHKESLYDPSTLRRSDYTPFGRDFFWETDRQNGTTRAVNGRYVPQQYPQGGRGDSKTKFVVWRNEELVPEVMSFISKEGKAAVKEAWKRIEARKLAKAKADAVAEVIRKSGKTAVDDLVPFLRDEAEKLRAAAPADVKAQRRAMPFPIRGVSPLTSLTGNPAAETGLPAFGAFDHAILPGPVQGFQLLPSENIKYPSPEFRAIMEDRTKPPGTVLVLADAPKDTYYVVTLVKRDEKDEDQYLTQVANGRLSETLGGPTIMNTFRAVSQRKAMLSILGLLKQEFKYEETEEQKKKLDENDRTGGDN